MKMKNWVVQNLTYINIMMVVFHWFRMTLKFLLLDVSLFLIKQMKTWWLQLILQLKRMYCIISKKSRLQVDIRLKQDMKSFTLH